MLIIVSSLVKSPDICFCLCNKNMIIFLSCVICFCLCNKSYRNYNFSMTLSVRLLVYCSARHNFVMLHFHATKLVYNQQIKISALDTDHAWSSKSSKIYSSLNWTSIIRYVTEFEVKAVSVLKPKDMNWFCFHCLECKLWLAFSRCTYSLRAYLSSTRKIQSKNYNGALSLLFLVFFTLQAYDIHILEWNIKVRGKLSKIKGRGESFFKRYSPLSRVIKKVHIFPMSNRFRAWNGSSSWIL